jgi:hypothetical protein
MRPAFPNIAVRVSNDTHIQSIHTGLLDLHSLPQAARKVHNFPARSSDSLLSIGGLSDHGFEATLSKHESRIEFRVAPSFTILTAIAVNMDFG